MPRPRRDARIVNRGAQLAAEARVGEDELDQPSVSNAADADDQETVAADADAERSASGPAAHPATG